MTHRKVMAIALGAVVAISILFPTEVLAQRHYHRAYPRTSIHVGVGVGFGGPYYYRPWFYGGWFGYGYPYGWYPPFPYYGYPYYGYPYYSDSSVRLQVEPKETDVYVDGYLAGRVDDFDGFFQRLHLDPGEHEVQLYLDGHKTIQQKIYLQPNGSFRIKHTMTPLKPGEAPDPRPVPPPTPPRGSASRPYGAPGGPPPGPMERPERERPEPPERSERPEPASSSERGSFGSLALRVQPVDADILIDGESWEGPDGSERLIVQLSEGEHRVEVRKNGFSTYSSSVRVRRGETTTLNISLARE